jgi:dTDP-4-amino-4,6-dideoxygalactose transaminase
MPQRPPRDPADRPRRPHPESRADDSRFPAPPRVRLTDPAAEYRRLAEPIEEAIARVLASGRVVRGPAIARFEREWAAYHEADHAVMFASGTAALQAALHAAGVGPGDEVIVPAFTFVATAEAVLAVGALPVVVDVDPLGLHLDAERTREAIGPRTRAVIPVHLYGRLHPLRDVLAADCAARGIAVIEDASQAHGARDAGGRPGRLGPACFSFHPSKNLGTCGEAGAVVTADAALAARLRAYRDHGSTAEAPHATAGLNLWPSEIEAAVLSVKLERLDPGNERRREAARRYDRVLDEHPGARRVGDDPGEAHARQLYVLRSPRRDRIREHLEQSGIETRIHYPCPLHEWPGLSGRVRVAAACPRAAEAAAEVLSLPVHPWMRVDELRRCLDALAEALDAAAPHRSRAGASAAPRRRLSR